VAARHRFLFSGQDGSEVREQYGRLFLEKIIHVPFQLAPIRSYERYVRDLLTISDDALPEDKLEEEKRNSVPIPSVEELLAEQKGFSRLLKLPLAIMVRSMLVSSRLEPRERWFLGVSARMMFGLELTPEQRQWLSSQDYETQISIGVVEVEVRKKGYWSGLLAIKRLNERVRQEILSTTIKIQESDRTILRNHMANLRGNPRSIKRFVNTYLLGKGINTLAGLKHSEEARLDDLAAWLVLLQNWPREGSIVCSQAQMENSTPLFGENWVKERLGSAPPAEMQAFVAANKESLNRLVRSRHGLDIARCFSFFAT
jgi:hypothetical protein